MLYRGVVRFNEHSLKALQSKNVERVHELCAIEIKAELSYFFYISLPFKFVLIFDSGSGSIGSQMYLLREKKANIINKANNICWISELAWLIGQLK